MPDLTQITRDSAELRRLWDRISETVPSRDRSPEAHAAWARACAEFHERFDRLHFPGGSEALGKLRAGEPEAVETAVRFLVADPCHFRSGYLKETLWHRLSRSPLRPSDKFRLEDAALGYLDRRISREFWSMCKAMARIGGSAFWARVASRARPAGSPEAFRATCLLSYGTDLHAGARLRRRVYTEWRERGHRDG